MASDKIGGNPPAGNQPPGQPQVIEADGLEAFYANFARVAGSPEELILDFGLNPQPYTTDAPPIKIARRVAMNFYTAKRLLHAMGMAIQRHEQAFGVMELDVNKRFATANATKTHAND